MLRPFVFMAALGAGLISPIDPPNVLPAVNDALKRIGDTSRDFIEGRFTPVKAETIPVDANAAASLDEDLDWRIAEQTTGWRAFLAKHPHGAHASIAQVELAKLTAPSAPPSPQSLKLAPVVEIANAPSQPPDLFAALERPPTVETKVLEVQTTVVKWRERPVRYVTRWRDERPRLYRQPPPPRSFGPPHPRAWRSAGRSCFADWRCRGEYLR